ncbi:MAG: ABC transporter ATP-binding protein [Patescibacteria group bacterium]
MTNYDLNQNRINETWQQRRQSIVSLMEGEWSKMITAVLAVLINAGTNVATPVLISIAIDEYISKRNLGGLNLILGILASMYLVTMIVSFLQTRLVGQVSQRVLFRLRENLFAKLQELPLTFFQQNKAGDIIARINSDTEKLNNFLSGSIFQFVSSFFTFIGIGVFIFFLNWQLALVVWLAVIMVVFLSRVISPLVNSKNKESLETNGNMIAFLDENLNNFKALAAFNKGEYLRTSFTELNQTNFKQTFTAQVLNGLFNPLYSFAGNIAQILVLAFGLYLLQQGNLTLGLLIGFISYTQKFYEPLRTLGNIWGTMQEAVAAWGRVQALLKLK